MIFLIENPFNIFLEENALWLALSFAFVIIIVLLFIFLSGIRKKSRHIKIVFNTNDFLLALGGRDNIEFISAKGSRLALSLKEKNLLNEEELKKQGVISIIKMSSKITLVLEGSAESIAEYLKIS
ncbi:MAG: hypothetical protein WCX85_03230 [Bacilli bacterium]|jgi:phosphotransferase system IIB component|nr:hypothetical protein [Bacilli bacterium]